MGSRKSTAVDSNKNRKSSYSSLRADSDRKSSLSASTGELRPLYSITPPVTASSDYWTSVSTFIGSFLKRRPTVADLPRHVLEMMGAPLVPRSSVIIACISYLHAREAHILEGIFRLSGLATEVQAVCELFKRDTFDLNWVRNPHTVATALKQYCRVSAILPSTVCATWANNMRESREDGEILDNILQGMSSLATENQFILSCLFSFLKLVLNNQEANKMAAHSLSVVWGPNLIHFHIPALDAFSEANIQATIMHIMLTHVDTVLSLLDHQSFVTSPPFV